ncbi:signal recognition particle-docking protein FtsY [Cyanobium sp. LEGE 06113]|uniref:signal recognition particle-docking protein FtsY n=1 Tax=Cyanobium sp. LEGE 06113 TaxID=1297573 RepID=UPI001880FDC4|nr:signal recognition particle-docking protein FtsY [Cyanobium sp. LEGE 06113]MBE9154797.1 signal recognition particle-docking protein FtsY [Cyanobium sp. LEGE 06113]
MVFDWFRRRPASPAPAAGDTPPTASPEAGPTPEPAPSESVPEPAFVEPAPAGATPATDQDALAWAREAYARLKAQQLAAEQPAQAPEPEPAVAAPAPPPAGAATEDSASPAPAPPPGPDPSTTLVAPVSLLEQAAAKRAERQQAITDAAAAITADAATTPAAPAQKPPEPSAPVPSRAAEPQLGAFDDTFTWSAEVLAAQGRRVEDVSLEEIDWLGRLRQGLEKTRQGFVSQLLERLGDDPLSPETLDDLETTLLRADVGVSATDHVLDALRQRLNREVVDPAEGIRFLKEQLRQILDDPSQGSASPLLAPERGRLNVWLLVGVNGVGKTTTLGKLANLAVRSGYSCLIAAADTFRAAAVQQVQVWGERSGVAVISNPSANADPAAVVYDALGAARAQGTELVLVDTAGRLQTKHNLMEELAKVRRIVDKLAPEAVVESLLVLDASQGQNGLRQAMAFASSAGLTGVVLTKLDGSARGGVALAVASEARLPIRFVGAGEGIRDLRPFNSFEFVEALMAG